jgi:hypothetical protein
MKITINPPIKPETHWKTLAELNAPPGEPVVVDRLGPGQTVSKDEVVIRVPGSHGLVCYIKPNDGFDYDAKRPRFCNLRRIRNLTIELA